MQALKIQTSNVIYLAICVTGILALFLVGIWPNAKALTEADETIARLQQQVKTQELLYPVYRELIKKATQKTPLALPVPQQNKIPRNDLNMVNNTFQAIAKENNVSFTSAVPDASSYLDDSGHVVMNVEYGGDFFQLRGLLLKICQLPYLESIEEMTLATAQDTKRIVLKLKFIQEQ
jgi:hypothetical protein